MHNAVNNSGCKQTNEKASFFRIKVFSPLHLDSTIPLKCERLYNEFTQYMIVGSWVKVCNLLLDEKIEASTFVYLQSDVSTAFCTPT